MARPVKSPSKRLKSSTRAWNSWYPCRNRRIAISTYLTPGVYRTPQVAPQPALQLVRTDIAGFVGLAQRGPLPEDFPPATFDGSQAVVKIGSWKEFLTKFGSFQEYGYLAYAVRAFFANGGKTCYVARVAATTASGSNTKCCPRFFRLPSGPAVTIGTISAVVNPFQCAFTLSRALLRLRAICSHQRRRCHPTGPCCCVLPAGRALRGRSTEAQITAGATVSAFPAACRISAASRGNWGNTLRVQILPPECADIRAAGLCRQRPADPSHRG